MDEHAKIHAVLAHIGRGGELADFPATKTQRLALLATASRRRLIGWDRARGRYQLTSSGRRALRTRRKAGWWAAVAFALCVVTTGVWLSADGTRLLNGGQMGARLLASLTVAPAHGLAGSDSRAAPAPPDHGGTRAVSTGQQALPETAPLDPSRSEPQPVPGLMKTALSIPPATPQTAGVEPARAPAADALPMIERKPVVRPKRTLAKQHHKFHASRHRRRDHHLARHNLRPTHPAYFGYQPRGTWSYVR
jgi:hypothetical protein